MTVSSPRLPVYWANQLIGLILNPTVDNRFIYGRWQPAETEVYQQVVAEFTRDGHVWVRLGEKEPRIEATIQDLTHDEIEVKIRPSR
jgi:hypothetical protein